MTSSREEQHDLWRAFLCYVPVQSGSRGPRQIAKGSARSQKARNARAVLHPRWGRLPRSRSKRPLTALLGKRGKKGDSKVTRSRSKQPARRREDDGKCTGFSSGILHLFGVLVSSSRFAC